MADTKSVSSGGNASSDALTLQSDTVWAAVYPKADNAGTPASGDEVVFKVLASGGDPDGSSTDEDVTEGHAAPTSRVDTNAEDPVMPSPIPFDPTAKTIKLRAENEASSNSVTVSGRVIEIGADGLKTSTLLAWS